MNILYLFLAQVLYFTDASTYSRIVPQTRIKSGTICEECEDVRAKMEMDFINRSGSSF